MIRNKILISLISAIAIFCPFNTAQAVEVLSAQELESHCKVLPEENESADAQYCIRYIQGFIDGAVATDVRVMLNLEAELSGKETFSERAYRTRVGDIKRANKYAEFCLGDPVPLLEVVEKIVSDLSNSEDLMPDTAAREFVYAALRKHYPCK